MRRASFLFLIFFCAVGYAQDTLTISGLVRDAETGETLIGATILISGTAKGTATNVNGTFSLFFQKNNIAESVLEIAYIGKETQYIRLGSKRYFDIFLKNQSNELDEVVVTSSYGTTKLKQEVVGSVTQLNTKDLNIFESVESVDKLLEGQVAGVYIESSPQLGAPVSINIRGQGTLTALNNQVTSSSTQPLIIIDGIVMGEESGIDNELFDGGGLTESFQNPLARLAPEDIESFSILKDAAAVSLYGADGANGVILITTKTAKNKRLKVGFSSQMGTSQAFNHIKFLTGPQYSQMLRAYNENSGNPINNINDSTDTNWFDLLNRNGFFTRNNVNVSKSFDKINFRSSLSILHNEEAQLGNNFTSISGAIKVGYRRPAWSLDFNVLPNFSTKKSPNVSANFPLPPNLNPYNTDGSFALLGVAGRGNPLAEIEQNRSLSNTLGALGSLNFKYKLTKNWNISSFLSLDITDKNQDRYWSGDNESGRLNGSFVLNGQTYPMWGRRLINDRTLTKWFYRVQTYYEKEWSGHKFDALLGFEINEEITKFQRQLARGFVNPGGVNPIEAALEDDDPETEQDETKRRQNVNTDQFERAGVSIYSQLNYNFKGKYFLLLNFRQDQSSSFGSAVNTGYNGGFGVSWNISKEPWLESVEWLDFLRIKMSYGSTGNSRINSQRSGGLYATTQNGILNQPGAFPSIAPNPNLSWERNFKFNTGVELDIFKNFGLHIDFYKDDIRDLIVSRQIPIENGFSNIQINGADMYNQGIEMSFRATWIDNPTFQWTTNFNWSRNENKITALRGIGPDFSPAERARAQRVGFPTSTIWGIEGGFVDPATGRQMVYHQGAIYDAATYSDLFNAADWTPIGDSQPDFYGGFRNKMTFFKKLSILITGNYALGHQTLIADELVNQYRILFNRNMSANALDHWRQPGDQALYGKVTNNNPILQNTSNLIYDLSHFQLRNINLSYSLELKNKKGPKTIRFFADVSNLWRWYLEKSPADRNGIREFRYEYPEMRTYTFGLNMNW